jgi:nitrous oxidase accessory protein NosD
MPRRSLTAVVTAFCLVLASVVLVSASEVLSVPLEFGTISEAVAAASPGDVVEVTPGTYKENVVITIPIVLRGPRTDDLDVVVVGLASTEPVLEIRLAEEQTVILEHVGIQTAGPGACILVASSPASKLEVRDCHFTGLGGYETKCIDVVRGQLVVEDCSFVGPNKANRVLDRSNGVLVRWGARATIRRCAFRWFEDAIQTHSGQYLRAEENSISDSMGGITLWNSAFAQTEAFIHDNTIRSCTAGISLTGHTAALDIRRNILMDTRWLPFRIALSQCPGTEDGVRFTGEITGFENRTNTPDLLCPGADDSYWPSGFVM